MNALTEFLNAAPAGAAETLAALACAESLTDDVAAAIYRQVPIPGLGVDDFVSAFKYSGLTEPRNSEWNLAPSLRQELVVSQALPTETKQAVHRLLLSLAQSEEGPSKAGSEIPSYLFTEAGLAYHLAGAGMLDLALKHYSNASKGAYSGAQWLGAKLAEEQERDGVIPEGRVETTFLRAWVLLREGHRQAAMPLFRKVAATDLERREVAISLHIVGNENNRGQRRDAERQLRRSIEIDSKLGNQFGVAQTLHSLANLLTRADRLDEAENAYKQSVEIGKKLGDEFHVAQTLHSLANLLTRTDRLNESEDAYKQSIEIDSKLGNQFGVAQTLHSLANLLTRTDRLNEAEDAYKQSIEIGKKLGDEFHVAQTLHSLANLLTRADRLNEAEDAYKQSIEIGRKLRNDNHLAQVLRSYALALESISPDRTIELLQQSLEINRRRGNARFVKLVERTIREVRKRAENRQ